MLNQQLGGSSSNPALAKLAGDLNAAFTPEMRKAAGAVAAVFLGLAFSAVMVEVCTPGGIKGINAGSSKSDETPAPAPTEMPGPAPVEDPAPAGPTPVPETPADAPADTAPAPADAAPADPAAPADMPGPAPVEEPAPAGPTPVPAA